MKIHIGRTEAAMARAEDMAHAAAQAHDGAKCYHIVEAFTTLDITRNVSLGRLYVADAEGVEELEADERFEICQTITSYGVDPEEA